MEQPFISRQELAKNKSEPNEEQTLQSNSSGVEEQNSNVFSHVRMHMWKNMLTEQRFLLGLLTVRCYSTHS